MALSFQIWAELLIFLAAALADTYIERVPEAMAHCA